MARADTKALEGALESPEDAGEGGSGIVKRWLLEWELASNTEQKWRARANAAIRAFRPEGYDEATMTVTGSNKDSAAYKILWANVEVIAPNVYNSTPRPSISKSTKEKNPVYDAAAEIIERALSYEIKNQDFDYHITRAVLSMLLTGRGNVRVKYSPIIENERLHFAKTQIEFFPWARFRRGSGATWDEVPWVGYEHIMTMAQCKSMFPDCAHKLRYDYTISGVDEEKSQSEPSIYKRVRVLELWDAEERKTYYIAPSYPDAPLRIDENKLDLSDYFDTPRPLYAIDDVDTLVPIVEYDQYRKQASELNRIDARLTKITGALRLRGIYDATLEEVKRLLESDDNEMIPAQNAAAVYNGDISKAIWIMPIAEAAQAIAQLEMRKKSVLGNIYEIMGIADVMRGYSSPSETLGAQELKAQTGSIRMRKRQKEVQRFIRDLFRKMAEIICQNYTKEMLTAMTGINVTPEIDQILKSDLLRSFYIDVETDSTISETYSKEKQDVSELMQALSAVTNAFGPLVQAGIVSRDAAKELMLAIIRKARLGREVEGVLDAEQQMQQVQNPQQNAEAEQMAQQAQEKQADHALKMQSEQAKFAVEKEKLMIEREKLALERDKFDDERSRRAIDPNSAMALTQEIRSILPAIAAEHQRTVQGKCEETETRLLTSQAEAVSYVMGALRAQTRKKAVISRGANGEKIIEVTDALGQKMRGIAVKDEMGNLIVDITPEEVAYAH